MRIIERFCGLSRAMKMYTAFFAEGEKNKRERAKEIGSMEREKRREGRLHRNIHSLGKIVIDAPRDSTN